MFKSELIELYAYLKRNRFELVVVSFALLFLLLRRYHSVGVTWQNYVFFYFLLPVLTIFLILRRNPLDFGLRLGNYKIWGLHLLVVCPIIFVLLYLSSKDPAMSSYYQHDNFNVVGYTLEKAIRIFAWEYIFRGFMLFGLKEKMKESAIVVQMIPFTLLHLGKPVLETTSCIISGTYFGYLAYRGNSFWPAFIVHFYLNIALLFVVNYFPF